jgi:hypothetical protein
MIKKYKIYFPKGIIHCKNYKERIYLHLLEHLTIYSLSKKFHLEIKGSVTFGYTWFQLSTQEKDILKISQFFKNIKKNILKKSFVIEKKRIFEELLWYRYNLLDPIRKIYEIILSKIYKFNFIEPSFSYSSKILKTTSLKDIVSFVENFFDYSEMIVLEISNNEYKIIKKPEKFIKFDNKVLYHQKKNFFKLKGKKLPSASIFVFSFPPDPKTILFINFLGKYLNSFIKEKIISAGLAYSYFYRLYYFFLDKIIILILIPSSKPQIIFQIFNKFLKTGNLLFYKSFMDFKKDISKIVKTKFFKYFEPYIVYSIYQNKSLYSPQKVLREIKNLKIQDFQSTFKKELIINKLLMHQK